MAEDPADSRRALYSYAVAVDLTAAAEAAWEAAGSPLTRPTSDRGPEVVSPLFSAILSAQQHETQLAARLGLDPAARQALSRRAGRPKSSDREQPLLSRRKGPLQPILIPVRNSEVS